MFVYSKTIYYDDMYSSKQRQQNFRLEVYSYYWWLHSLNEELRIISKVKKMDSLSIKVYKVQLFSFCCIIDLDHESQAMRFKEFKSNRFFLLERKLDVMKRIQVAEAILDAFQCFILWQIANNPLWWELKTAA